MSSMPDSVTLILGLIVLIAGADLLVRGAAWFARALGLSKMLVGLTLVAFGTSAPELVVCVLSAVEGNPGLATGTVLGSNAANIGLIVGSAALLKPIEKLPSGARFEIRFALAAALVPLVPFVTTGRFDRIMGGLALATAITFTYMLVLREQYRRRNNPAQPPEDRVDPTPANVARCASFVLAGLAGLVIGGRWLVSGAEGVATGLGISQQLVGVLIVAVGTSLPELATSIMAARAGHPEIALGNVLGSNIFNVFLVLGTTGVVAPIPFVWSAEGPIALLGLGYAITLAFLLSRSHIGRAAGAALLIAYALFMVLFPPAAG